MNILNTLKDILKDIRFTIALLLIGAIFTFFGMGMHIKTNNYDAGIQDAWSGIPLAVVGVLMIAAALYIEFKGRNRDNQPDKDDKEKKTSHLPDSMRLGAILYFQVASNNRKYMELIRKRAIEFFNVKGQTYPPVKSYYYWYKEGGDYLSVFVEPHRNESIPWLMAHAFLLTLTFLRKLTIEISGDANNITNISVVIHTGDDIAFSQYGEIADYWGQSFDTARKLAESLNSSQFIISHEAFPYLARLFKEVRQGDCRDIAEQIKGLIPEEIQNDIYWLEQDLIFELKEWKLSSRIFEHQTIHNLTISNAKQVIIGNSKRPSDWIQLEHRDASKPNKPTQRFVQYLTDADEICIVGMTHENTAEYLSTALQARNGNFWKNIQIIFPSERTLAEVKERDRSFDERQKRWEDSKKQLIIFFESKGTEHLNNWSCIESDENFSFWGNRLRIKDKYLVRVAPLIQGADLKEMPYMTFSEDMDVYKIFSDAFDVLITNGNSIVEWDLFGKLEDERFIYGGIASHARLSEFPDYWKPVTLVMLHTHEIDQHKILLQKRSIFNATDGNGKYSNISGRLCVSDIVGPEDVRRFYREIARIEKNRNIEINIQQESTIATEKFFEISKFKIKEPLSPDVWEKAAIREIREELGITIDRNRLRFERQYNLSGSNLNFRIYSLEISANEHQEIRKQRPYAGLESFSLTKLKDFHRDGQFNRLLQNRFKEVFLPIFENLHISL